MPACVRTCACMSPYIHVCAASVRVLGLRVLKYVFMCELVRAALFFLKHLLEHLELSLEVYCFVGVVWRRLTHHKATP